MPHREVDYVLVKAGDGETPEEFVLWCGIENAGINSTVNTSDRARRDCENPAAVPQRKVKVISEQTDISGSGVYYAEDRAAMMAKLGIRSNYQIEEYTRLTPTTGELIGTHEGPFVMTANNISIGTEDATAEITLASDGAVTYTPVTPTP